MIAEKAEEAIEKAVAYELQNIVKKYGAVYASNHEAYAVLLEEVEEAKEEYKCMKIWLKAAWRNVKDNQDLEIIVKKIKEHAIELIKESVQCAAVCERFIETLEREEKHEKLD